MFLKLLIGNKMINSNTILGVLALLYGFYTLNTRSKNPEKLIKLKAMKQLFGDKKGNIVHFAVYTILPFLFGVLMLLKGVFGITI